MIQPVRKPQTPSFSTVMPGSRKYADLVKDVDKISQYLKLFAGTYLDQLLSQVVQQVNTQVQGVGPILASASTIIPTAAIHHISGTAVISNINAPAGFSGPLFLVADGAWTMNTAGNIALAVAPAVDSLVIVVYDYVTTKWYPQMSSGAPGPPGPPGSSSLLAGTVAAVVGSTDTPITFATSIAMPYVLNVSLESSVGTSVRVVPGTETTSGFTARLGLTTAITDTININYSVVGSVSSVMSGSVAATPGSTDVIITFSGSLTMPYVPIVTLDSSVGTSVRVVPGTETVNGFTARLGLTPTVLDSITVNYVAIAI